MRFSVAAVLTITLGLAACGGGNGAEEADATPTAAATTTTPEPNQSTQNPRGVRTITTNLRVPWGIGFLPGGDALVTERTTGQVKRVPRNGGRARTVARIPGVDTQAGEGGLLGLAISPNYRTDRRVYVYLTTANDNRIAWFRYGTNRLTPVLTGLERSAIHNGGRIAFGPDGKLYATVGDASDTSLAQNRESRNGKILRINPDGSVPDDNPFPDSPVWTLGHRNPQGIAWDSRGRMYSSEFGQNRFDEINRIEPGKNYGWPDVEGRGDTDNGRFTNPLRTWPTADASPSGIAIAGNRIYMAALRGERLFTMPIRANGSLGPDRVRYQGRFGRLRTVAAVPGGRGLWLATSNRDGRGTPKRGDDRIVRIPR